jgi:hypothetical protein
MPTGNLVLKLTDMAGEPVRNIDVELTRLPGEPGTGGETMHVSLVGPDPDLTVLGITCRGGPGTMYKVSAEAAHYKLYAFFQLVREERNNAGSDDVEFWVEPGDVTEIRAPAFAGLPPRARAVLDQAAMIALKPEDADLVGLTGEALYRKLGPLRKAGFLNLVTKAADEGTTGDCLSSIHGVMVCRQDRFFARVDKQLPNRLANNRLFRSANPKLHDPLPGFERTNHSFKSRDAHANLQVTFMREIGTENLAADVDIDESTGVKHGLEVIKNATFNRRTNPYLIREFLLNADPIKRSLDPGYQFVF